MENNPTTQYQPKNTWKIAAISLIVLAVILAGTTSLFAVKSAQKQNELNDVKNQISQNDGKDENGNSTGSETETPEQDNRRYLTITEWGVKFEIPEEFSDLSYEIQGSDGVQRITWSGTFNLIPADFYNAPTNYTFSNFGGVLRVRQNQDEHEVGQYGQPFTIKGNDSGYNFYFQAPDGAYPDNDDFALHSIVSTYLLGRMMVTAELI